MSTVDKKNLMKRPRRAASSEEGFKKSFSVSEDSKKQLTLKIDSELHRKIKSVAAERQTTITDLISDFIRDL